MTFSVSAVATAGSFQPQAYGSPLTCRPVTPLPGGMARATDNVTGTAQAHRCPSFTSFQGASDRCLIKKMCQPATTRSVNITPTVCNEGHGIRQNQTALGELTLRYANNKGRSVSG